MKIAVIAALAGVLLAAPALAQTPAAPPTDLEIEQVRAKMLEGQLAYFIAYLRKLEHELAVYRGEAIANMTNPKGTADWWSGYATAQPPQAAK